MIRARAGDYDDDDDGGPRPLRRFSGGEQDLANLCLRLALSRTLAERQTADPRLIILDEVFGSQDVDRRQLLLEHLRELERVFSQVFIVSHFDDVADACDVQVEASGRASSARRNWSAENDKSPPASRLTGPLRTLALARLALAPARCALWPRPSMRGSSTLTAAPSRRRVRRELRSCGILPMGLLDSRTATPFYPLYRPLGRFHYRCRASRGS